MWKSSHCASQHYLGLAWIVQAQLWLPLISEDPAEDMQICVCTYGSCRYLHVLGQCCLAAWVIIWVWQQPLNAGISFPSVCSLRLSAVIGTTGRVSVSSLLLEEYYSSKADENCGIFEGGRCMRSAWYASSTTCWVFRSRDFIVSVLVNIFQGTRCSFLFSIPFLFSFYFVSIHSSESPAAIHWVVIFADVQKLEQCSRWQFASHELWLRTQHESKDTRDCWCNSISTVKLRVSSPRMDKILGDFLARAIFYAFKLCVI